MVTSPVFAVILLFPLTKELQSLRLEEQKRLEAEDQHPVDPTVFWMKQTVSEP